MAQTLFTGLNIQTLDNVIPNLSPYYIETIAQYAYIKHLDHQLMDHIIYGSHDSLFHRINNKNIFSLSV